MDFMIAFKEKINILYACGGISEEDYRNIISNINKAFDILEIK